MQIEKIINISKEGFPPEQGDLVEIIYTNGNTERKLFEEIGFSQPEPTHPTITIDTLTVQVNGVDTAPVGDIYWLGQSEPFAITATLLMPEGFENLDVEMVIMVERVVDSTKVVDDERYHAQIANATLTVDGSAGFGLSGNYIISPHRLNRGLERIGAPFRVDFAPIEFDVIRKA